MDTQQLSQAEWSGFLNDMSRQFEQGLVSVTVGGNGLSHAPVITELPLLGIQLNTKGSDTGSITVIAGQSADDAISHTIPAPTQIQVARDAPEPAQTQVNFLSSI